jgi:AcrR family transcriptional regulator
MKVRKISSAIGRPREFCTADALDKALRLFWEKGYEGTSLSDLTDAMGINRPSLYAAFGNKESLFRKALERYESGPAAYVMRSLDASSAKAVVEGLFEGTIDLLTDPRTPNGCLTIQGALACSAESDSVRTALASKREAGCRALVQRFERAKSERDLPPDCDPEELARFVMAVIQGISVQGAGGANRKELMQVAQRAMLAWPAAS